MSANEIEIIPNSCRNKFEKKNENDVRFLCKFFAGKVTCDICNVSIEKTGNLCSIFFIVLNVAMKLQNESRILSADEKTHDSQLKCCLPIFNASSCGPLISMSMTHTMRKNLH